MKVVKVGIIGMGNIGKTHSIPLFKGHVKGAVLAAVCGRELQKNWVKENLSDQVKFYHNEDAFFQESDIDAVIIATPHYSHPELAIKAFHNGLHVLLEKPAGVFTKKVIEMNKAAKSSGKVFSMMFNQRTNPLFQKLRHLIQSGELGEIKRTNWVITDWYRPQSYYDSGKWRATWKGEGGGVLLNQAPHQLYLWQWTTGMMPKRVHAFCHTGKYHKIEVEDDVTAYVEYENGATGAFITSTGEAPGSNRFEIAGDRGKIIIENDMLTFYQLTQSEREFNSTFTGGFGAPESIKLEIPIEGENTGHVGMIQNWIDAITKGTPLLAPGEEGLKGVELANAMYLSSWLKQTVELPIDADLYLEKLQEKINQSTLKIK